MRLHRTQGGTRSGRLVASASDAGRSRGSGSADFGRVIETVIEQPSADGDRQRSGFGRSTPDLCASRWARHGTSGPLAAGGPGVPLAGQWVWTANKLRREQEMADACKALGAPEIAGAWIERKGFAKKGMNAIASAEIGGLLGTAVGTGLSGKGTPKPTAETPSFGAYGYLALSANDLVLVKAKQGLTGMKLTDDVIASVPDAPSPPPSSARARSPPRLRSSSATAAPGSSKSRAPVIAGRSESLLNSALDVSAISIYDTGCRRVRGRRARSPVAGGARQAGWDRPGGCRTALGERHP